VPARVPSARAKFLAVPGDPKIGVIDVRDILAVAAAALTALSHDGRTYDLTGPRALTFAEMFGPVGSDARAPHGRDACTLFGGQALELRGAGLGEDDSRSSRRLRVVPGGMGEETDGQFDPRGRWPMKSSCVLCGQPTLDREEVHAFHLFRHEDDWAAGNRIMCDLVHRGIGPPAPRERADGPERLVGTPCEAVSP
jgi:hypothetical protein